jgi:hypothetical protein
MALAVIAALGLAFGSALGSGGHTGSEMARIAHAIDLQSAGTLIFGLVGGITLLFSITEQKVSPFVFAVGLAMCLLSGTLLVQGFQNLERLDTASQCGTYDRYC